MAIYRLLKNCTLEPKEVSCITEAYEKALHTLCVKDRDEVPSGKWLELGVAYSPGT
jgi:hypothetical protein